MNKARYLYSELAVAIQARKNCMERTPEPNTKWFHKWTSRIVQLERNCLPSGSGIDNGCSVDLSASHAEKLVILTAFHHMDESGGYDGWTEHTVTVTPSFSGINIRISGPNRNDIKEYLHQIFYDDLTSEIMWQDEVPKRDI